ncbi:MAG: cation diffusion facilitator family transporter [Promethearchaeota archaeon]
MVEINKNLKYYEQSYFINIILLICNSILFILKLIFGLLTKSLALQADAFDSMTDIVMCLTALIGILFTKKKPNDKFPYGYYKMENIISLIISLFIFFTAYYIIINSILDIFNFFSGKPRILYYSPLIFLFLILSLLISLFLMLYLKLISKRTGSPIIKSEANEKMFDILISLSVLIGFIGFLFNFYILDSIIGLIIAIFIIKGGYDIFLNSTKTLLDAIIDFDNRKELYNLIEKFPKIKTIENMEIRSYGRYTFLEIDISLSKEFPLSKIDALKNNLTKKIKNKFPTIFKIIIIIHSQEKLITKIAIPLKNNEGLNSNISKHFGECPYFGFLVLREGNFLKFEIIINKFAHEEKRKGLLVSEWLISEKIDKIYLKKPLKKGPSLILNNNFVEEEVTNLENLNEIIKNEEELLKDFE